VNLTESTSGLQTKVAKFIRGVKDVIDPPLSQTYVEKIMAAGYQFEEHKTVTEDGYILSIWRISGKIKEKRVPGKKPIIFTHGLLDDAYTWIVLNPNSSLPMMLSNQGYDIWIPNCRGNIFSTEHVKRDKFDSFEFYSDYWNFTLHEIALYDLPAIIDYVRNYTGFEKVYYIGHSQGTTTFYINFMTNPSYLTERIDKFVGIGNAFTIFNTHSKLIKTFQYT